MIPNPFQSITYPTIQCCAATVFETSSNNPQDVTDCFRSIPNRGLERRLFCRRRVRPTAEVPFRHMKRELQVLPCLQNGLPRCRRQVRMTEHGRNFLQEQSHPHSRCTGLWGPTVYGYPLMSPHSEPLLRDEQTMLHIQLRYGKSSLIWM